MISLLITLIETKSLSARISRHKLEALTYPLTNRLINKEEEE